LKALLPASPNYAVIKFTNVVRYSLLQNPASNIKKQRWLIQIVPV